MKLMKTGKRTQMSTNKSDFTFECSIVGKSLQLSDD